jgi:hypothetical protein
MTDSDPQLRSASERYQRARKMREVWSNHATRHRSLRELPLREGLEGGDDGFSDVLSKRPRRVGRRRQVLVWETTKFSNRSVAAAWA